MISSKKPMMQKLPLRGAARAFARARLLDAMALAFRNETERSLRMPRVQNLYLHFLPPSEEDSFIELIRRLKKKGHHFLSFSEGVDRIKNGTIDQPLLTLSFDDGFESNLRAARILADEGISACFFVCPDLIGRGRRYLERVFPDSMGEEGRCLNWGEVENILDLGHEIGSHTLDHPVLSDIPLEAAREQIYRSRDDLTAKVGAIKHFAWPRGRFHHFRPELVGDVFDAGYESCSSAVRGAHVAAGGARPCVRRDNWEGSWPTEHMEFLLARSVRNSEGARGEWPADWAISRENEI